MPEDDIVQKAASPKPLSYRFLKRAFDIVFSAGVVAITAAPGAVLCIFVAVDTKSFPIYTQLRVGKGGKPFHILKFRTMVDHSYRLEEVLAPEQVEQWTLEHKLEDDPRITPLGRFLRTTSIDEIPQFVNALLGQISVVGPRPITFEELEFFGDCKSLLLSCPPGITGLWQTGPRNKATFQSGERQKMELEYVANASLALDAKLILKTVKTMLERTGK